jgi:hypothetical protein
MRISNSSSIRNIMYLCKNCEKSAQFFVDILGNWLLSKLFITNKKIFS